MFERYTEKARRVIFFSRYEASVFGSPTIDTQHLLLGLLREDKPRALRILKSPSALEGIRTRIESETPPGRKISTSVDLPISPDGQRTLMYAGEEASRLNSATIDCQHLWLALLRQEQTLAGRILSDLAITPASLEETAPSPSRPAQSFPFEYLASDTFACLNEARRMAESRAVTAGHLLLACLELRAAVALRLLGSPEAIQKLRAEVLAHLDSLPALPGPPGRLSAAALLTLGQATVEAEDAAEPHVTMKQLWLGLLAVDDQSWLASRGIDREAILKAF